MFKFAKKLSLALTSAACCDDGVQNLGYWSSYHLNIILLNFYTIYTIQGQNNFRMFKFAKKLSLALTSAACCADSGQNLGYWSSYHCTYYSSFWSYIHSQKCNGIAHLVAQQPPSHVWVGTRAWNLWFLFPLALDLWLSSHHQKVIKWQHNDEVFTKKKSLFSQYSFWMRTVVNWWLFNDDLRAWGWEPEKKETTNSLPRVAAKIYYVTSLECCDNGVQKKGGLMVQFKAFSEQFP